MTRAPTDQDLLRKARGLLLDTNVLMLMVVGQADPELVPECGRTRAFRAEDYARLGQLVALCPRAQLVYTPHVAAEAWNLLENSLPTNSPSLARVEGSFKRFISAGRESSNTAVDVVNDSRFRKLGLTDTCIVRLARKRVVTVTVDSELAITLGNARSAVINFTHYQFPLE